MTLEIVVVALLILLNGFFALSEMSVVTARKPKLRQMATESRRAKVASALAEHPERFLSTVQVGITLIGILTGVFGGQTIGQGIARWLQHELPGLDGWLREPFSVEGIGLAIAVCIITFFSIVFGELLPKRLALLGPERLAILVAVPMDWMSRIAAPFVWLLSVTTQLLMRVLGRGQDGDSRITEEEVRLLVAEGHEQGLFDADERNMMSRVLRLGDRSAESLMTPRTRMAWLDVASPLEENLATMRHTPYSRYPVMRGSEDEVLGVLEVKALLGRIGEGDPDLFRELRPPLFVAESTQALKLLEIFREEQQTLALVVDEYGDIQGMVTLNDLLGAIVGRLQSLQTGHADESVVQRDDGSWLIDGSLATDDLRELLTLRQLPEEADHDYNTVAGMMIARFGRIPQAGEHFHWQGWRFEVVDLDGARIDKLLVQKIQDSGPRAEE